MWIIFILLISYKMQIKDLFKKPIDITIIQIIDSDIFKKDIDFLGLNFKEK